MILNSVLASMASSLTMFMANLALAKIGEHRVIKGGVNRLKKNCERLALMMESAEGKVMLDDEVTRYWLKRFKDHMYQVEDIVDQWIIKNNAKPTVYVYALVSLIYRFHFHCFPFLYLPHLSRGRPVVLHNQV